MKMRITKNAVKKIVKELNKVEAQSAKYGNGTTCYFQRLVIEGVEFTLVDGMLYVGVEGATITRIKEGRREDNLIINGERVQWAELIAKNITKDGNIFFTFGKPFDI